MSVDCELSVTSDGVTADMAASSCSTTCMGTLPTLVGLQFCPTYDSSTMVHALAASSTV